MAGIYIHIPFCKQACTYCNFHFSTTLHQKESLLAALQKEITLTADAVKELHEVETIYFGGGTPSLLSPGEIENILETIREKYSVSDDAEITLEANPDDVSILNLQNWKTMGINRFSLGIQSFQENELRWMNRAHTANESLQSIDNIQAAGFQNFSVDLIYGSPLLTHEAFKQNINIVLKKNIPHVSAYALTVEPKTPLDIQIKKKTTAGIDEAHQAEQFDILVAALTGAGYEQYEISNFAKPGFRSKHNTSYWQGKPYFGFGPSAHSFDGKNKRHWNIANNALYIKSIEQSVVPYEEEVLTETQELNERIMISLRTMEGINLAEISKRFGEKNTGALREKAAKYLQNQKLTTTANHIILSKEGKFFADGIAAELFF